MEAICQRVADIDKFIAEQKALRKKLINHLDWFQSKSRKSK